MARGKFRIYLGAAPGVGKTYAMLEEGWRRVERGTDVVAGLVVTYGRPKTIARLARLEFVPGKPVSYGYDSVDELDVGSIVNITSLGAERCLDRYPLAAYNAAKAGVAALTRSFASEWGPHGVRANSLGPAFFPTRLSGFLQDPSQTEWIASHTALRRPASLDELDGALLFLASDASSYVTGQHLFVDGGWSVY